MFNHFVKISHIFWLVFLALICHAFIHELTLFLTLPLILIYLFMHRGRKNLYKENFKYNYSTFLSPVSGDITLIRSNIFTAKEEVSLHEVTICSNWKDQLGFFLPTTGEIIDIKFVDRFSLFKIIWQKINIFSRNSGSIEEMLGQAIIRIKSNTGEIIILKIIRNILGVKPEICLRVGDRGKVGAYFGHTIMGGKLKMYFPSHLEILAKNNTKSFAADTMIAGKI